MRISDWSSDVCSSDLALGGTVSFVTKDPSDYLEAGKDAYFGLRLGYDGSWDGLNAGAPAAFGAGRCSGMAVVDHHQGQATENRGTAGPVGAARTRRTPQDHERPRPLSYARRAGGNERLRRGRA